MYEIFPINKVIVFVIRFKLILIVKVLSLIIKKSYFYIRLSQLEVFCTHSRVNNILIF